MSFSHWYGILNSNDWFTNYISNYIKDITMLIT